MYKNLIINYVKNMNMNDVDTFIKNNNISITDKDKITVFNHIKKYYNVFFEDPIKYINMLKDKISDDIYYTILDLYNKYKDVL